MNRGYDDIRDRIAEPPKWWDEGGVPRYCEFTPRECGVYDEFVALCECRCQGCREPFLCAVGLHPMGMFRGEVVLPSEKRIGSFHYGDPPIHGCIGDTMNIETIRVREFWRRDGDGFPDWRRDSAHEIDYGEPVYD